MGGAIQGKEGIKFCHLATMQGKAKATALGALYYMECSAVTGEGLTEVFEEATR